MTDQPTSCVYGAPPAELVEISRGALQVSPLHPGSRCLENVAPESVDTFVMAAPPGTVERRYALALALRALRPGGTLVALAPKEKGGSRIGKELSAFGCNVSEEGRRHQRICQTPRPSELSGIEEAIAAGAPRLDPKLGLWTWPGVFSWDRPDPGSLLLMSKLPALAGKGADFGSGTGLLAQKLLSNPTVTQLDLVDLDRRAVDVSRRNVDDPRARFHWADVRTGPELSGLDFVVMNPPFHEAGSEDKALGQAFIRRAHQVLRKGGVVWLVANRHLPYEGVLSELFSSSALRAEAGGFKVYEARK